jgi:hypothetical protein
MSKEGLASGFDFRAVLVISKGEGASFGDYLEQVKLIAEPSEGNEHPRRPAVL